jgi:hypothetical protein
MFLRSACAFVVLVAPATAAAACPDVPSQLEEAWAQFDDAEVEQAKSVIERAYDSLACQESVLDNEELLALYRLDALVSLALGDEKGAVYATIRAVSANPEESPPAELGPELRDLFGTWSSRLANVAVDVSVADGGQAWIDGRLVTSGSPLVVVEGDHLIQTKTPDGLVSAVVELSKDHVVTTGVDAVAAVPVPEPEPAPLPAPLPVEPQPVAPLPKPAKEARGPRNRPMWLIASGIGTTVLGGATLAWGGISEQRFVTTQFHDEEYAGCQRGSSCYDQARADAITSQAIRVRTLYTVGYSLVGAGAGLTVTGVVGFPGKPAEAVVGIRGRF